MTESRLLCSYPRMEEGSRPLRGMLVAESDRFTARAVEALLRAIDGRCARLTVAAVTSSESRLTIFAPMAGYDPVRGRDDRIAAASRAALLAVGLFPEHVPVRHCATECWRDVLHIVRSESYDLLALSGLPARRRDRSALEQASKVSGTRFVFA